MRVKSLLPSLGGSGSIWASEPESVRDRYADFIVSEDALKPACAPSDLVGPPIYYIEIKSSMVSGGDQSRDNLRGRVNQVQMYSYESTKEVRINSSSSLGVARAFVFLNTSTAMRENYSFAWHKEAESTIDPLKELLNFTAHIERKQTPRAGARYLMAYIEHHFSIGDLGGINELLQVVDFSKLTEWSIMGMIRSTFRARNSLYAWTIASQRAKLELVNRGLNVEGMFVGIQ